MAAPTRSGLAITSNSHPSRSACSGYLAIKVVTKSDRRDRHERSLTPDTRISHN